MKSIKNTNNYAAGLSLVADDLIEFHASRLLLLIAFCGIKDQARKQYKIEGLTKLAKLDFFVRYPEYFKKVALHLNIKIEIENQTHHESEMIRFHYGPWDERYYQILPYLEARNLLIIEKHGTTYNFFLTDEGYKVVKMLSEANEFDALIETIKRVSKALKKHTGTYLKDLIYKVFDKEVASKKLNETIK